MVAKLFWCKGFTFFILFYDCAHHIVIMIIYSLSDFVFVHHIHMVYVYIWFSRKKKLTPEWRNFIRPEMWRLKWLELQIKELLSQTQKYDSELAKYDKEKLSAFEGFTSEGFDAMPTPKLMKRKKRKRVEDTTDIALYMSHHNLFSYGINFPKFSWFIVANYKSDLQLHVWLVFFVLS